MRARRTAFFVPVLLAALAAHPANLLAQPSTPPPAPEPLLLPEEQRAFFQDGPGLLLTDLQREDFLWKTEAGRTDFIREFLDRDPIPETPENELRIGIERRQRLGRLVSASPLDVRVQILFLRGLPTNVRRVGCRALRPLEIWEYGPDGPPLVIYRAGTFSMAWLWLPEDTRRVLYDVARLPNARQEESLERRARETCTDFALVERATGATGATGGRGGEASHGGMLPQDRVRKLLRPADLAAWARQAAATPLPPPPPPLATGDVELDFPRLEGKGLTVRALVPVSPAGSPAGSGARITLAAVIETAGLVVEKRQARYRLPAGSRGGADGPGVPLLVEGSPVFPGVPFLLRLRLRDEESGAEALVTHAAVAPHRPAPRDPDAVRAALVGEPLLLEDRVGPDSLLLPPSPEPSPELAGPRVWRVVPLVTGKRITRVDFLVDGQVRASLSRTPFAAEVLLAGAVGEQREQVVRAEGYDADGLLVAADEVVVPGTRHEGAGAGERPFRVDLAAPAAAGGGAAAGGVLARARVTVPEGRRVETVEIRLNDAPVAVLTAPPWEARADVPAGEPMVYLSAVARLDDGSQAEDVHFLRAPDNLQEIDVRLVELYATVIDRSARPVADLTGEDFEILEAGRPQALARFERVQDLPLNLGLVLDSSVSMTWSIAEVQRAAGGFLSRLLRPRDRAFVLGFASRPYLLVAPTGDAEAMRQAGLPELRAKGDTALYDSLATAVFLQREGRGQRAIVLLSDGRDTASHAGFQQALDFARHAGVTVYAIGLGLRSARIGANLPSDQQIRQGEVHTQDYMARGKLAQLAAATGGREFVIDKAEELEKVYRQIEEDLRSRYLLAYQTERREDGEERSVEVRVKRRGLKARTARGYYP